MEDGTIGIRADFVNRTDLPQAAALHYLIHRELTEKTEIIAPDNAIILDALMYEELELKARKRKQGLNFDGMITGEMPGSEYYHDMHFPVKREGLECPDSLGRTMVTG